MLRVICATALVAMLALDGSVVLAQSTPPARFGVLGGVSLATLGGKDVDEVDQRTGVVGGVSVTLPIRGRWSLEVDGLFSQKGATASDASESLTVKLDYFEVPLLARYDFDGEKVRPHLAGGVGLGFRTSCEARGANEEFVAEVDCATIENDPDSDLRFRKFDLGLVVGGGLDFLMANDRAFTVGARYVHGVTDVVKEVVVRNRTIQLYVGFSLPLR